MKDKFSLILKDLRSFLLKVKDSKKVNEQLTTGYKTIA
jgi:hypothetical protein